MTDRRYQCSSCLGFVPLADLTERGSRYVCGDCAEAWDARRFRLEPVDTGRVDRACEWPRKESEP
jgi:hypothetical protein